MQIMDFKLKTDWNFLFFFSIHKEQKKIKQPKVQSVIKPFYPFIENVWGFKCDFI